MFSLGAVCEKDRLYLLLTQPICKPASLMATSVIAMMIALVFHGFVSFGIIKGCISAVGKAVTVIGFIWWMKNANHTQHKWLHRADNIHAKAKVLGVGLDSGSS